MCPLFKRNTLAQVIFWYLVNFIRYYIEFTNDKIKIFHLSIGCEKTRKLNNKEKYYLSFFQESCKTDDLYEFDTRDQVVPILTDLYITNF